MTVRQGDFDILKTHRDDGRKAVKPNDRKRSISAVIASESLEGQLTFPVPRLTV